MTLHEGREYLARVAKTRKPAISKARDKYLEEILGKPVVVVGHIKRTIKAALAEILCHTVAMVGCLISISIVHFTADVLLGNHQMFFNLIPVMYIFQAGDIVVIAVFIIISAKNLIEVFRK